MTKVLTRKEDQYTTGINMTSLKQSKEQPNVADIFEYKVSNGYRTVLSLYPIAPSKECLLFGICL